jgi:hypothetical protein
MSADYDEEEEEEEESFGPFVSSFSLQGICNFRKLCKGKEPISLLELYMRTFLTNIIVLVHFLNCCCSEYHFRLILIKTSDLITRSADRPLTMWHRGTSDISPGSRVWNCVVF